MKIRRPVYSVDRREENRRHPGRFLMQSDTQTVPVPKARLWLGRIISALPALFLLVDGAMKLVKPEVVVKTTVELGYTETVILPLGVVLLACTILYLIPRTAVLGAILFPVVLGVLLWGGLVLRDDRMRTFIPLRN